MKQGLNRILSCIALALLIAITAITALAPRTARQEETPQQAAFQSAAGKERKFIEIGQLRITTKPDNNGNSSLIVATPCLEYSEDRDFREELDRKYSRIKETIEVYFKSKTLQEIRQKGEEAVNAELLADINSLLVLQKIKRIYFLDYQFLKT